MFGTGNIKLTRSIWVFSSLSGSLSDRRAKNVEEIQRSSILVAMAEEVAMRGASSVTVAQVSARAHISRRAFYEMFADIQDCFLATFDWTVDTARAVVTDAYAREDGWREGIRSALAALLRFFDEQPLLAQLCIVHAAGGGSRVLEHRSRVVAELCEAVHRGRLQNTSGTVPGPVVAEGVVGAVLGVLYTRLLARKSQGSSDMGESRLIDLHGELMSVIVLPYLGANVAGRELGKAPPPPPARPAPMPVDSPPGHSAPAPPPARLTYRTLRVLRAIAELPAGSNREVAQRAGVVDQGQISKILARLQDQGLVENHGSSGSTRGTPNSWWLTERGEDLERELRDRPAGHQL